MATYHLSAPGPIPNPSTRHEVVGELGFTRQPTCPSHFTHIAYLQETLRNSSGMPEQVVAFLPTVSREIGLLPISRLAPSNFLTPADEADLVRRDGAHPGTEAGPITP